MRSLLNRTPAPAVLVLSVCALLCLQARAADAADADGSSAAPPAAPPAALPATPPASEAAGRTAVPPATEETGLLESTRRSVRSSVEWLARAVDGSFGDKSFDRGGKVGDGRVDLGVRKRQGEPRENEVRFNAQVRLPNLERRVHVFFGNDDERDVVTDNPEAFSQRQRLLESRAGESAFFAGIKVPLFDAFEFRLGVRAPLKPFAQASYDRAWPLSDADTLEFRETLFWSVADHFGSTTVAAVSHAFTPTLAGRWLNATTITQATGRFEWNSVLGAYRAFGAQRSLALEALASGTQGSGVGVSDYGVQVRFEQPLYNTWLLGEIGIGHFWPRKDALSERRRAWGLGATLKMKF